MFFKAGDDDTICALSTSPGVGGIAVIRVSGPRAASISRMLCRFLPENPESHRIYYGLLKALDGNEPIDEVVLSFFAHGRSFTGEETVEISCHGGRVTTASILKELVRSGARTAQRGEFTYRAFMNGRIDLVQAESVLGLIESQSKQSARVALRQLQGHLSAEFGRVEDDLLWILAQLEANIDFSAEGLQVVDSIALVSRTEKLIHYLDGMIKSYSRGRLLREGLQVALVGRPNVGKSSLLNALLREDRAIVTEHAGTTRDLIEGQLSFDGVPVTFVDTAGLRETSNEIEKIGIQRSRLAMEKADLVLYILDLSDPNWRTDLQEYLGQDLGNSRFVFNKLDLDTKQEWCEVARRFVEDAGLADRTHWISAQSRLGIDGLESHFSSLASEADSDSSNVVTQARHLELIEKIQSCLVDALALMKEDSSPEFIAFELQESIRAIHELLGKEFHEQVIDRIFKEFCLGK